MTNADIKAELNKTESMLEQSRNTYSEKNLHPYEIQAIENDDELVDYSDIRILC